MLAHDFGRDICMYYVHTKLAMYVTVVKWLEFMLMITLYYILKNISKYIKI